MPHHCLNISELKEDHQLDFDNSIIFGSNFIDLNKEQSTDGMEQLKTIFRKLEQGVGGGGGGGGGGGRVYYFRIRVSCSPLHITIYLMKGRTDYECSPSSIIVKKTILLMASCLPLMYLLYASLHYACSTTRNSSKTSVAGCIVCTVCAMWIRAYGNLTKPIRLQHPSTLTVPVSKMVSIDGTTKVGKF